MGNKSSSEKETVPLRPHILRTENKGSPRSALILGPTGATGKFIVSYIIMSPEWSKVTIAHRREVDLDDIAKKCNVTFDESQKSKVTQHVLDMEKMAENEQVIAENAEKFKGHDVTFCVLGTTRGKAGSAENFRKVDQYMVRDGAILSKRAGVAHFSLLTSKGAKSGIWANDWKISHGLLYLKVKGDAEQAVIDLKFPRTSIFRPGFLAREGNADSGFISKLDVRDLAAVMLYDAESEDIPIEAPLEVDSEKEEKKENENESNQEATDKVEDPIFYEGDPIDELVPLARKNYNAICLPSSDDEKEADSEPKTEIVDDKGGDDGKEEKEEVEATEKEQPAEDKADPQAGLKDAPPTEVVEEPPSDKPEEAKKDDNDTFEVVEKPEETEATETAKENDGDGQNEEFVEVDSPNQEENADTKKE